MNSLRSLLAAIVVAPGLIAAAHAAETVVPAKQTATPVVQSFPGRAIDVVGIAPGMTEAEIRKVLNETMPGAAVSVERIILGMEFKGIRVRLEDFPGELEAKQNNERIEAVLSSPVTGSRAIILKRQVEYKDLMTAPTVTSMIEALKEKYGAPSLERKSDQIVRLGWYLNDKGQYICPFDKGRKIQYCEYDAAYDRNDFPKVSKAVKAGLKMGVDVTIYSVRGSDRVSSVNVLIDDFVNHMLDIDSVDTFLKSAVDQGMTTSTQAKPKL